MTDAAHAQRCWICGDPATTGEHIVKRSDLIRAFPKVSSNKPLFMHTDKRRNRRLQSHNSKALKWPARICEACNTSKTQNHDRAWERLSDWLCHQDHSRMLGDFIRANRVFPVNTSRSMRYVHLYFVKAFGCMVASEGVPIDLSSFGAAILGDRAHPEIYLKFWRAPRALKTSIGPTPAHAVHGPGGQLVAAHWIYALDVIWVEVVFVATGAINRKKIEGWHPRDGTSRLTIHRRIGDAVSIRARDEK